MADKPFQATVWASGRPYRGRQTVPRGIFLRGTEIKGKPFLEIDGQHVLSLFNREEVIRLAGHLLDWIVETEEQPK